MIDYEAKILDEQEEEKDHNIIDIDFEEAEEDEQEDVWTADPAENNGWVIAVGSLFFGLKFRGPFATHEEAVAYRLSFHAFDRVELIPISKFVVN